MPELPEVETVRKGLEKVLQGRTITHALLRRGNLRMPFPPHFAERLAQRNILRIRRRAKYLLIELDHGETLIVHLGMSGHFSVEDHPPASYGAHDHVIFTLDDGRFVIYRDPRRFGLMTLTDVPNAHPLLADLGPEPMGKEFSPAYLKQALAKRQSPVKVALMDQTVVVGVGNIYACEALFDAHIDPRVPSASVAARATPLVASIQRVLKLALDSGGSSLRDFIHVSGELGYFQHHFNVYGRTGKPCITCHHPTQNIRMSGRSTFFCSHCQYKPSQKPPKRRGKIAD